MGIGSICRECRVLLWTATHQRLLIVVRMHKPSLRPAELLCLRQTATMTQLECSASVADAEHPCCV